MSSGRGNGGETLFPYECRAQAVARIEVAKARDEASRLSQEAQAAARDAAAAEARAQAAASDLALSKQEVQLPALFPPRELTVKGLVPPFWGVLFVPPSGSVFGRYAAWWRFVSGPLRWIARIPPHSDHNHSRF